MQDQNYGKGDFSLITFQIQKEPLPGGSIGEVLQMKEKRYQETPRGFQEEEDHALPTLTKKKTSGTEDTWNIRF